MTKLSRPSADVKQRGGIAFRLLTCDTCRACWPTERDERHGGSRQDGEPCAYRWPTGKVCKGTVHPMGWVHPPAEDEPWAPRPAAQRRAYTGNWCAALGLKPGTLDLALVRKAYRRLAKLAHPDAGGSHAAMVALNEAYRQALAELGQPG